jgi:hypothetical protein
MRGLPPSTVPCTAGESPKHKAILAHEDYIADLGLIVPLSLSSVMFGVDNNKHKKIKLRCVTDPDA